MVEWKKLGDVCEFLKGRSLSKNDVGLGDSQVILYGELYTTYGDYITSIKSSTSSEIASEATKLKYNDLVLPVSSTTKEAQIGKVSVIKEKSDVSLGSDAIILRNAFNPNFLMYYLNSTIFEKQKMNCVHGTTIMHLSPKELAQKIVPIPSASEQQRIVDILDTFTSSIDNLKQQIAQRRKQLEYYRDKLLDRYIENGAELKRLSRLSLIKVGPFGSLIHKEDYIKGGIPLVNPVQMVNGHIIRDDTFTVSTEMASLLYNYFLKTGDIVFARRGEIGRCAIVTEKEDYFLCGTGSLFVRFDGDVNSKFMLHMFNTSFCRKYLERSAIGGSMLNINCDIVGNMQVPVLPLSEQQRIVDILDQFEASIQNLEAQLKLREKQYEYYRNKLLTF